MRMARGSLEDKWWIDESGGCQQMELWEILWKTAACPARCCRVPGSADPMVNCWASATLFIVTSHTQKLTKIINKHDNNDDKSNQATAFDSIYGPLFLLLRHHRHRTTTTRVWCQRSTQTNSYRLPSHPTIPSGHLQFNSNWNAIPVPRAWPFTIEKPQVTSVGRALNHLQIRRANFTGR